MSESADPIFTPRHNRSREESIARIRAFNTQLLPHTPRLFVAYSLVVLNIAVFVVETIAGVSPTRPTVADLIKWGGDFGPLTTHGQWWRLLSCVFVHAGILHLAMNMYVLFSIGPFLERVLGNIPFLVLYLFAGICGSIVSLVHAPTLVSIGASGAIFGLYGALAGFLLRAKGTLPKELLQQLWRTAGAFVVYNAIFGFVVAGLDQAAHFGGFIGGFLGGLMLGHPLDVAGFAGRKRRSAALVAAGALVLAAAIALVPKSVDFAAEMQQFVQLDHSLAARTQTLYQQLQSGKLTKADWSDHSDKELVQPWLAEKTRLQSLRLDARQTAIRARMLRYLDLRVQSLQESAKATRNDDSDAARRAQEWQDQADELAPNLWKP